MSEERGGRECPREIPRVDLSSTLSSASVRLSVASSRVVRPPLALALHGCQMPTAFALSFAEWCPFEEGTAQDAEKGRGRADKHLSALSDLFSLALSLSLPFLDFPVSALTPSLPRRPEPSQSLPPGCSPFLPPLVMGCSASVASHLGCACQSTKMTPFLLRLNPSYVHPSEYIKK